MVRTNSFELFDLIETKKRKKLKKQILWLLNDYIFLSKKELQEQLVYTTTSTEILVVLNQLLYNKEIKEFKERDKILYGLYK